MQLVLMLCAVFSGTAAHAEVRLMVNMADAPSLTADALAQRAAGWTGHRVIESRRLIQPGSFVLRLDAPAEATDTLIAVLRAMPGLKKIHPDFVLRPVAGDPVRPDDPLFSSQQASYLDSAGYASLRMPSVWSLVRGSAGVVVGVLDSGVLFNHPELRGRLLPGYDFVSTVSPPTGPQSRPVENGSNDGNGRDPDASDPGDGGPPGTCGLFNSSASTFHGTAVSSVIAANTGNGFGMAGINGAARILPLRISGQCGFAMGSDILDAMYWAVGDTIPGLPVNPDPARVLNLSFAGGLGATGCTDSMFEDAIARVRSRGAIFVVAAGNGGGAIEFPANCRGALAVGTVLPDGTKAGYSAYGTDSALAGILMAPADASGTYAVAGNNQLPDGRPNEQAHILTQEAGTSFSAPVVSGLIALLLQARPDWTADQAVIALRGTARPFPAAGALRQCPPPGPARPNLGVFDGACACTRSVCGDGIVSPLEALQQARAGKPLANPPFARTLDSGTTVSLDGSLSTAAASGTLSYRWTQVSGPAWPVQSADSPVLRVTPLQGSTTPVVFALRVTDSANGLSHEAFTSLLPAGSTARAASLSAGSAGGVPATAAATAGAPSSSVSVASGGGGGGRLHTEAIGLLLAGLACLRVAAFMSRRKVPHAA